jgi:hypothetical protein
MPSANSSFRQRLLAGKIERRRMPLVLAGAGVHQDRVMRGSDHESLVGNDHHSQRLVENLRLHGGQVTSEYGLVIGREEVLRPPPRAFAFNYRIDGDITDPDLPHFCFPRNCRASIVGANRPFNLEAERIRFKRRPTAKPARHPCYRPQPSREYATLALRHSASEEPRVDR